MKDYARWRYGADRVAVVGNLSRLGPRSVLKDLGKAMRIPYEDVMVMANIIEQVKDLDTANVDLTWTDVIADVAWYFSAHG